MRKMGSEHGMFLGDDGEWGGRGGPGADLNASLWSVELTCGAALGKLLPES